MSDRRTLYVYRPIRNPNDLISWAKSNGFSTTLPADDLHVTIAFSKTKLDWGFLEPANNRITNHRVAGRVVKTLGNDGAVVLGFKSTALQKRWDYFRSAGASWDWPSYQPHMTISYNPPKDVLLKDIPIYSGPIILGAERFCEIKSKWMDSVTEKAKADLS